MNIIFVQLFHIIFVGGFLFYVGLMKTELKPYIFNILIGLAIFIFCFHLYKATTKKNPWINIIHICIIAPLIFYIGYNREKTPRFAFEILLMLAITAIGYNGFYLIKENVFGSSDK